VSVSIVLNLSVPVLGKRSRVTGDDQNLTDLHWLEEFHKNIWKNEEHNAKTNPFSRSSFFDHGLAASAVTNES
jgi:hypothetical protein